MAVQIKRLSYSEVAVGTIGAQAVTYDNSASGIPATNAQEAIDFLAAASAADFTQSFLTTDWVLGPAGYTITILESAHGKATTPEVTVLEAGAVVVTGVEVALNGDVTLTINSDPDARFAGTVIIS